MRRGWMAAAMLAVACARPSPEDGAEPRTQAMVRVENRGFSDMAIYVIRGGQRSRLGIVSGHSTATFSLPSHVIAVGPVHFLADPIGSDRTPVSDELTVEEGDIVELVIPSQ